MGGHHITRHDSRPAASLPSPWDVCITPKTRLRPSEDHLDMLTDCPGQFVHPTDNTSAEGVLLAQHTRGCIHQLWHVDCSLVSTK